MILTVKGEAKKLVSEKLLQNSVLYWEEEDINGAMTVMDQRGEAYLIVYLQTRQMVQPYDRMDIGIRLASFVTGSIIQIGDGSKSALCAWLNNNLFRPCVVTTNNPFPPVNCAG